MTEAEKQEIMELADQFAMRLGELCDSVTILVTAQNGENTFSFKRGNGNFYARLAMAREFLNEDKASVHHAKRPAPPDDSSLKD